MRLPGISAVLALAAGLASAVPIRVIVVSTSQRVVPVDAAPAWAQSIRWGHAAAPAFNSLPPLSQPHSMSDKSWVRIESPGRNGMIRKGGCRGGMRAKSMELGNKLRVILGLPPIDPHLRGMKKIQATEATSHPTHHRHHHAHHHTSKEPFIYRLSHALASLTPWEGRAVSFVLGCGLGAVLRMLFVFGVLLVRSVRCQRQEQPVVLEEDTVIFVADIKEPLEAEALPAYAEKTDVAPQGNNVAN
ncbi:unnamed protein product [Rhizoctonia solani]|uniref:Uncharacterized protein n=1 Tax=Rhizoctonia solani TaxID=456999 RepID=A0A8H2WRK2_9AGAM|nr:unnamed protein product [Rhizoctonia solani]